MVVERSPPAVRLPPPVANVDQASSQDDPDTPRPSTRVGPEQTPSVKSLRNQYIRKANIPQVNNGPMDGHIRKTPRNANTATNPPASPAIKRKVTDTYDQVLSPSELSPDDKRHKDIYYARAPGYDNPYPACKETQEDQENDDTMVVDDDNDDDAISINKIASLGRPSPVRANHLPARNDEQIPASASADVPVVEDWAESVENENAAQLSEDEFPDQAKVEIRRLRQEVKDMRSAFHQEKQKNILVNAHIVAVNSDFDECRRELSAALAEVTSLKVKVTALERKAQPQAGSSTDAPAAPPMAESPLVERPEVATLTNSMGRGIDTELRKAEVTADGHVFPGATIADLADKAALIFTPYYQPKKILVQVGGIDALRYRAPRVTKEYKRLVGLLRALCPQAELVLSQLTYKDYWGKNQERVIEGINRKTRKPEFFVPGDRLRIDNINHSLNCWARDMNNVQVLNAKPGDKPENFSRKDGLHYSREGRDIFLAKVVAFFTGVTIEEDELSEASMNTSFMSDGLTSDM